jgi:hypothetical protein
MLEKACSILSILTPTYEVCLAHCCEALSQHESLFRQIRQLATGHISTLSRSLLIHHTKPFFSLPLSFSLYLDFLRIFKELPAAFSVQYVQCSGCRFLFIFRCSVQLSFALS